MFFDDPVAAFSNIARTLRHGGRLCMASWQPLIANDWLTIPGAALLRYGSLPDADPDTRPGMFAQSDPAIVQEVITASGFRTVDVQAATVALRLGTNAVEATAHLADTGVGRAVLATIPDDDQTSALQAVTDILAKHTTNDGVLLNAAIWITTAHI